MTIRRARAADLAEVRRCVFDAYAVYLGRLDRPPAPLAEDYAAEIRAGAVFVAEDGSMRGVVVLIPYPDHLFVRNLAVRPELQRQGIGSALLDFAERRARSAGLPELRLETNERMTENLAYYARRGFRETGRGVEDGYHRVFLAKSTDPPPTRRRRRTAARAGR